MGFLHEWRQAFSGDLEKTLRGTSKIAGASHTEMFQFAASSYENDDAVRGLSNLVIDQKTISPRT